MIILILIFRIIISLKFVFGTYLDDVCIWNTDLIYERTFYSIKAFLASGFLYIWVEEPQKVLKNAIAQILNKYYYYSTLEKTWVGRALKT